MVGRSVMVNGLWVTLGRHYTDPRCIGHFLRSYSSFSVPGNVIRNSGLYLLSQSLGMLEGTARYENMG